jgi:murein DD-endopeptidase MepM/ murein hydrolase activator NlpD
MTSPHGRRAAPKPPARVRPHTTGTSASRPTHSARDAVSPARAAFRGSRSVRPALSAVAMTFVGGMMVATSVPAHAVTATEAEPRASVYAPPAEDSIAPPSPQTIEVASEAEMKPLAAEGYTVEAAPPPIVSEVTTVGSVPVSVPVVDGDVVVWPVVDPERRASGFGPREAPCAGCSTFHDGVDFNPGEGTPVMSIADGVVVLATEDGGGLGVNVEVQHNIGGELITSSYAHMQYGSIAVSVGQTVTAGQQLGLVGTTGQSTGPHLHLEMFGADGVRFDGFAWLSEHVG